MKIKNIITAIIAISLICFSSPCFAKIDWEDLKIGDIYYDQPIDEVIAKYGRPVRQVEQQEGDQKGAIRYIFNFQGSNIFVTAEDGFVTRIGILGDSKFSTSRGIGLRATKLDILKAYGEPDFITGENERTFTYRTPKIKISDPDSPYRFSYALLGFKLTERSTVEMIMITYLLEDKDL